jgi:exodeoxyribonuclease VII large subunit
MNSRLSNLRWSLGQAHNTLARLSPRYAVNTYRQRLDEISLRMERAARVELERKTLHLAHLEQSLRSLNPQAVLNRGYAIVTRTSDGALVKRFDQVNPQDDIRIQVSQGTMDARILQTHQENKHDR